MRVLSIPGVLPSALIGPATAGQLGASAVLGAAHVASLAAVLQHRADAGVQGTAASGMDGGRGSTAVAGARVHAHSL